MSEAVVAQVIADLLPFANKDGVIEIVMRGAKKRLSHFRRLRLPISSRAKVRNLWRRQSML